MWQNGVLPVDTEFLISDQCIVCGDEVSLPKICILTGDTEDLEKHQAILNWTPPLVCNFRVIMLLLIVAAALIFGSAPPQGVAPGRLFQTLPLILVGLLVGNVLAWYVAFRTRRRARVTWYTNRQLEREEERRVRLWKRRSLFGVCVVCLLWITSVCVDDRWLTGVFPTLIATAYAFSTSKRQTDLVIVGQHEGLNILAGLSSSFMQNVDATSQQYHSKQTTD